MLGKRTKYKIVEMEDGMFIVKRKLRFSLRWSHLRNGEWYIIEYDPERFFSKESAREALKVFIERELERINKNTVKTETPVEISII